MSGDASTSCTPARSYCCPTLLALNLWEIFFLKILQRTLYFTRLQHLHCAFTDNVLNRSIVSLFATLWTVARQAPQSMGFSRQEYWSGLPFLPPGDLPDPGIEPESFMFPPLVDGFFTTSAGTHRYRSFFVLN